MYMGNKIYKARLIQVTKDLLLTAVSLVLAYIASSYLLKHTIEQNNSALIFVLAVVVISRFTRGYFYGILASVISVFFINYYFMYPYSTFNVHIAGYPVAIASLLLVSTIISALTSRMILQSEQNKRLYEEQAEMKLATEKERIRGNLLRAVSHDLRTPLTGIIGSSAVIAENIEGLKIDDLPKAEIKHMLQNIEEDAEWLVGVLENMLSITRVNSDVTDLTKRDEILEEVLGTAIIKVKKRYPKAEIILEPNEDLLVVPMDPILIEQVIINLIENAIKHAKGADHIRVKFYKDGRFAKVEIIDNGEGFEYQDIDELIEAKLTQRIDFADGIKNAGIGLSVCKSIIAAHDGILEGENLCEGGSRFGFLLPIKEIEDERANSQTDDIGNRG